MFIRKLCLLFLVTQSITACGGSNSSETNNLINNPPTAHAGSDQTVSTSNTVTLDASASSDSDNDLLTYNWSLITKPLNSTADLIEYNSIFPSFTADLDGDYIIELIVNDGTVNSAVDSVTITSSTATSTTTYAVVDTNVSISYNDITETLIPLQGEPFYGQDANYSGNQPSYTNNQDGTITDNITGLMWQQDMGEMVSWDSAIENASMISIGGYTDWRMPTLKELFSLIYYSGQCFGENAVTLFIDDHYFNQPLGDTSIVGGREIDAQTWTATDYNGITMIDDDSAFGVNFIDGRVKAYPKVKDGSLLLKYARYVRGNINYGINKFVDNQDGTVSDSATGLMWMQNDSGTHNWQEALNYSENLVFAGYNDWRLPNAKELQTIVDYSKGQFYAAINENFFNITSITDPDGGNFYPYFWTSTTLLDGTEPGNAAVYIPFGRALGMLNNGTMLVDAHGAGATRADPKNGSENDYPAHTTGFQGDMQYVYNYVRAVRSINTSLK